MTLDFDVDRFDQAGRAASRRDFLIRSALATTAITIGGHVLPLGSLFTGTAGAQALADPDVAAFVASLEYAAVATYAAATATGKVTTKVVADAIATYSNEHKAHGDALADASGGKIARDTPNPTLMGALTTQVQLINSETDVVKLAYQVENAAAATHQFALGALKDVGPQKLVASILPIEAGHAAVFGQFLFMGDPAKDKEETWLPTTQTEAGFIDPAKNPLT